jgi:hypothetical protein
MSMMSVYLRMTTNWAAEDDDGGLAIKEAGCNASAQSTHSPDGESLVAGHGIGYYFVLGIVFTRSWREIENCKLMIWYSPYRAI